MRYNDVVWLKIWRNLASMEGLRELRAELDITWGWQNVWTLQEITILEHIKEVTKPKVFELVLPFPSNAEASALLELPCQIRRTCDVTGQ